MNEDIRKRIDQRIKELGSSRRRTSIAVTGTEAFLRHYMSGDETTQMGHINAIKLAEVLDTTVDWILFGTGSGKRSPGTEHRGHENAVPEPILRDVVTQLVPEYEESELDPAEFADVVVNVCASFSEIKDNEAEQQRNIIDLALHRRSKKAS